MKRKSQEGSILLYLMGQSSKSTKNKDDVMMCYLEKMAYFEYLI
jgi:hypothetical protein